MENKELNLVEILKDCPKGTELYTPMFGKVRLVKVDMKNVSFPIYVELQDKDNGTRCLTSDGKYSVEMDGECVLFPSKENRDWSTFVTPRFKKGDFVVDWDALGAGHVMIVGDVDWNNPNGEIRVPCMTDGVRLYLDSYWCRVHRFKMSRLATEEEKRQLIDILKSNNYAWNEEKCEVRKIKKQYEFKPFEKVLVRYTDDDLWKADFFSNYNRIGSTYIYNCIRNNFAQCIPYEGNEHLIGTCNSPDFKTTCIKEN